MNFDLNSLLTPTYSSYPEASDKPIIGITTNTGGEDFSLRQRYCEQVVRAGGVPVLLTPITTIHHPSSTTAPDASASGPNSLYAQQLDICDAVIFTGGGDHNPLWMGEDPIPDLHGINPQRDSHELPLCRLAYNRHMPMFGICRGIQTLAVALDGHVKQHISTGIKHSQDAPKPEATHMVHIAPESILYNIYKDSPYIAPSLGSGGTLGLPVNSFHHQAVDNPGPRFRATASSADGIIEAIESSEFRKILGVQWHPEQMEDSGLPLFQWLVREAAIFRNAKRIHKSILTIDSHCDTPMFFPQNVDFLSRDSRILYDLHKMDDGHIDAVSMVCYLPQPKIGEKFSKNVGFDIDGPTAYADLIFDKIEDICNQQPDRLSIAITPADLYRDKREGRHSIVLGIENGIALEHDIRNIQHFKHRGVSYITLCHNGDNDICDSARGCNTHGGISKFGRQVIAEMNRLGIMVDLSHANENSFYQALEVSQTPIVCSHSNCRALCDHPRNLTDDQMRALAARGGVMQLTLYHGFLRLPNNTAASKVGIVGSPVPSDADITDFLRHLDHAIAIMGIDHVGIGTDFDGDGGILGLRDASELINITEHLLHRRFSADDIAKIWGRNWLRVMSIVQQHS